MEPLAKPSGQLLPSGARQPISLAAHTRRVSEEAAGILAARPFLIYKYAARTGRNLAQVVRLCAKWHDAGKAHERWQKPCQEDYSEWLKTGKTTALNLQRANFRHEMDSLAKLNASEDGRLVPWLGYAAIAAHHGKLGLQHEKRWVDYSSYWNQFMKTADAASFDEAITLRYEYDGPRALLQLADHRASAAEEFQALPRFRDFDYTFPAAWQKRGVQKLVAEVWDEPFAMLRAPTGAGKTDASLLWAQRQIAAGRADRLIIAMPTRFTATALSVAVTGNLSRTGLYHSSAWFQASTQPTETGRAGWKKELEYARLLETPVTVTTLDHLCICLTGAREDHHGIFWAMAHACVVIDEADFYDDFTQRNMVVLLRALRLLKVPVLVMSATLPESARQLYGLSGLHTPGIREDTSKDGEVEANRPRCQLVAAGACAVPEDVAELLQRGIAGEPLIIYANTVRRAQAYWKWFKDHEFADVVLYHSRFMEPHKAQIEERLRGMLGADAWRKNEQHGVAILTQIGELSVNISADLMVSDLCPIDRLTQRVGRLSRFAAADRGDQRQNVVGELHLVEPQSLDKEGNPQFYPAPYGSFHKGKGWQMTPVLEHSRAWLTPGTYSARQFVDLVNRLYPEVPDPAARAKENQDLLEQSVVSNWLVLPFHEIAPDDDSTQVWKSRDIDAQKVVYAEVDFSLDLGSDTHYFPNSTAFREWALSHSITIPAHEHKAGLDTGRLEQVTIIIGRGNKAEKIAAVRKPFYSIEKGLVLYQLGEKDDFMGD